MARPRKEIDREQFIKLCNFQCTLSEIASWFGCSEDTIERWCKRVFKEGFADTFKKNSGKGKIALRREQFRVAESGNVTMLVWLGKQYLGQRDAPAEIIDEGQADDKFLTALEGHAQEDWTDETD